MTSAVQAGVLSVAYESAGDLAGWPVVLLHGFPYDVSCYDEVAPLLAAHGAYVLMPYLRGYGPTRFARRAAARSGEQAALAADLVALLDALDIGRATLAGYDWGGRAACIVAALQPHRVRALVTGNGYNIQDIARSGAPADPATEHRLWYQYYLHGERGRAGLAADRAAFCRLLWQLWSPTWSFSDSQFAATAESFDNPDFVDVVVHSYRHRYGLVGGDPAVAGIEAALAAQPPITVPTISLDGADDDVNPAQAAVEHAAHFTGPYEHRTVPGTGHNLPQEAPRAFAEAILTARQLAE